MDTETLTAIGRLWEAGRSAFPEASVDLSTFTGFVLPKTTDAARLASLRGPDLYLACACAAGDRHAILAFEAQHLARIPAVLARRERSPAVVDEVRQLVRTRLLVAEGAPPRIAEYGGTGSLDGWVRVVTLRVHANLRRQDRDHFDVDEVASPAGLAGDPELLLVRARCESAFRAALRDAFAMLSDRDRAIFRLQVQKGLTLDQMALVFQVHR